MGGHIVVASLELGPGLYQGGLAECGLVDGIGIADYLLAYTPAAELIAGAPLRAKPTLAQLPQFEGVRVGFPGTYGESWHYIWAALASEDRILRRSGSARPRRSRSAA